VLYKPVHHHATTVKIRITAALHHARTNRNLPHGLSAPSACATGHFARFLCCGSEHRAQTLLIKTSARAFTARLNSHPLTIRAFIASYFPAI
jgi:hypothetical protein